RFRVGASIGIVGVEQPAGSLEHALQRADAACFAAKDGGRNRVCVAEEEAAVPGEANAGEVHWAQRLRIALERNDFALFGQPMKALDKSTSARHCEVLLRLRDNDGQPTVLPGAFLPVADRYGLASELDRWVIAQLASRVQRQGAPRVDHFWINLSPATLEDDTFAHEVEQLIATHGLAPGTLNFELREIAALRHADAIAPALQALKALGCRIAIDAFAGGTSSFECLRQLPIDMIKIDGSHVRAVGEDPIDRIFVRAMIEAANELGLRSCAMHTESPESINAVLELGADYAQGHAIAAPQPLFTEHLAADRSGVAA
ncbi:MAG: GGDEF domain-containing phosphodiesterase, partial [Pseudomonadota bacterium]